MSLIFSTIWPDFGKLTENPVMLVMYGFVLFGAAALGAVLTGLLGRYSALIFWKDLSRGAVLRLRLLGGLGGAAAAFALLGTGGGFGFGPGPGGLPGGKGPGEGNANRLISLSDSNPSSAAENKTLETKAPMTISIEMLGASTRPANGEPDRYFSVAGDASLQAMNVGQIVERIRQIQAERQVEEVKLLVSKNSSSFGRELVKPLRNRILNELRVPFSQPDFDGDWENDRSRFEPPKKL